MAMAGMVVSAAVCGIFLIIFVVFYFKSKGLYDEYVEYLDKDEYGLKDFIPIGLAINEIEFFGKIMPLSLRSAMARHNNQVYQKILEIRGPKEAEFYHFIHSGYRMAVGLIAAVGLSVIGAIQTAQGRSDGLMFPG